MEEQLYELLKRCTIRISDPVTGEHGTGYFVAPQLILTCAHVVESAQYNNTTVKVDWNGQTYTAQIKFYLDKPYPDLAILNVNVIDHPCVYLHNGAIPGNFLYCYGYVEGYSKGEPATFEYEGESWNDDQQPHLKFKAGQALSGLSGAPLLNWQTGGICGILQKTRDRDSAQGGRAVPTKTIFQALEGLINLRELQKQFHQLNTSWIESLTSNQRQHVGLAISSLTDNKIDVFYSYAHEDETLRNELAKQLKLLKRQGKIDEWYDREITGGEEWEHKIDVHLNTASIILLLVSPDFITSDYCYDTEMMRAMERHELGEARVIPVILRPTDWHSAPFGKLQALPKDGKPITTWSNHDEAFLDVARGIRKVVEA
jgi:hypothetical protein